ncbi:PREDICTED: ras association domain-containing protein 3 isoform X2 [Mandrillus leucophaeus]|uniref:ras association domain-containing protein 3 isoform X2 n=1 Tax=Mandrillus leucophaeus TaxID=9568 RepID=UPI0005F50B36|nr:PREDICTED: ras association domain-containing protein 3 isoform X2 [Mandrillus leucophaeus]
MKLESGKPSAFQNYRISCVSWTRKKMSSCRTCGGATQPTDTSWKKPSARSGSLIKGGSLPARPGAGTDVQNNSKCLSSQRAAVLPLYARVFPFLSVDFVPQTWSHSILHLSVPCKGRCKLVVQHRSVTSWQAVNL